MTAPSELFHFLVSPLPETATAYIAPWVSHHYYSTTYYDHSLRAELRFSTTHNVIYLDHHRSRGYTSEKIIARKKQESGYLAYAMNAVFSKRRCGPTPTP